MPAAHGTTFSPSCVGSGCSIVDVGGAAAAPDPAEIERRRAVEERNRQRRIAERAISGATKLCRSALARSSGRYWTEARGLGHRCRRQSAHRDPGFAIPKAAAGRYVGCREEGSAFIGPGLRSTVRKATFRAPRLSLGPIKGGAVRLAPAGELLMVSEGIETGAAAMTATAAPVWRAEHVRDGVACPAAPAARGNRRDPGGSRPFRGWRARSEERGPALAHRGPARADRAAARAGQRLQRCARRARFGPDAGGARRRINDCCLASLSPLPKARWAAASLVTRARKRQWRWRATAPVCCRSWSRRRRCLPASPTK